MLKKIYRKLAVALYPYAPQMLWNQWSDDFALDTWQSKTHLQHEWLLAKIRKIAPKTILEVGCGFGRNINFLASQGIDPTIITGVDISNKMLKIAKKKSPKSHFQLVKGADTLPFSKKSFDLAFTHGVLMHIPPAQILESLLEIVRVTKKDIVIIEQNYPADNTYTYLHNYKELLSSLPIDVVEYDSNTSLGLDMIHVHV